LPGLTDTEVGEAVTPLGKPLAVRVTSPEKPSCPVTSIATFAFMPPTKLRDAGLRDKAKLPVVVVPPPLPLAPPPQPDKKIITKKQETK
jgi:hypothetical protein